MELGTLTTLGICELAPDIYHGLEFHALVGLHPGLR